MGDEVGGQERTMVVVGSRLTVPRVSETTQGSWESCRLCSLQLHTWAPMVREGALRGVDARACLRRVQRAMRGRLVADGGLPERLLELGDAELKLVDRDGRRHCAARGRRRCRSEALVPSPPGEAAVAWDDLIASFSILVAGVARELLSSPGLLLLRRRGGHVGREGGALSRCVLTMALIAE